MSNTATETAPAKSGRKQRRKSMNAATFIKRLTMEEGSVLRVTVTDTSDAGLGCVSIIPLRVGDRLAVGLTLPGSQPEMVLSRVEHCSKNAAGQFRFGLTVLERQPGDLVRVRVPPHWLSQT
ncbi:MAG TPA: hypothetical protein VHM90_07025 [Phycisphaerae bacterium]|jgi:hypothetical protein|nr:hypothetical protein [Phycisphaerae bacterium]